MSEPNDLFALLIDANKHTSEFISASYGGGMHYCTACDALFPCLTRCMADSLRAILSGYTLEELAALRDEYQRRAQG